MDPAFVLSSDSPRLRAARSVDHPHRRGVPQTAHPGCSVRNGADQLVVEADQVLSGIGLISNAGRASLRPRPSRRWRARRRASSRFATDQHLKDMRLDGVAGEVLYPSQGLFYFKVQDTPLMSAIFRAYNDWLADFCSTDPARLKGIAMVNLDDVQEGVRELDARLERASRGR